MHIVIFNCGRLEPNMPIAILYLNNLHSIYMCSEMMLVKLQGY
jgi:hypothetical protein